MNTALSGEKYIKKTETSYGKFFIGVILVCALLNGFVPSSILSIVVLGSCAMLATTKELYLVFPIMLFYYERFGTFMGMSVYRYYSLLFLLITLLTVKSLKIKKIQIAPLILYALYCVIVVSPDSIRRCIFLIVDILCVTVLINHFLDEHEKLKHFFKVYVFAALAALVTGICFPSTMGGQWYVDGDIVDIVRYTGTFEDPNYAGFFYMIAIFAMITLHLFNPKTRALIITVFYVFILMTSSITAIVMNIAMWMIYLLFTKKGGVKTVIALVLVLAVIFGILAYIVENPDNPVFGTLSVRLNEKLEALKSGDVDEATTNRTGLTRKHWEYFKEQTPIKMLIGFNAASPIKTDLDDSKVVAHNEYVDWLLNVGIIGAVIMLVVLIARTEFFRKQYQKTKDEYSACMYMFKAVWILYAFTLTVFGDYRFMMFFLM